MAKKETKTNVMRLLDSKKCVYESNCYFGTGVISGQDVAKVLNEDPNRDFKTLVCIGASKKHYVFVLPVNKELNLKAAAKSVGDKSVELIKLKDLLGLTGYVHGGCSPIGMKKFFETVIDSSALNYETVIFSGGKIGYQVEISLSELTKVIEYKLDEISM